MSGSQKYSPNSSNVKPEYFLRLLDIFKKCQILLIGLIEDFSRNSVNIFDCQAFSLFEAVIVAVSQMVVPLIK